MAHSITFDTLAYAKKLIAAGVPEKQAEVQAEVLAGIVEDKLVTKHDLKEQEVGLSRDIKELEVALRHDIKELELRLKYELTLRFGIMLAAAVAILAAIIKF